MIIESSNVDLVSKRDFVSSEQNKFTGFSKVQNNQGLGNMTEVFGNSGRTSFFQETLNSYLDNADSGVNKDITSQVSAMPDTEDQTANYNFSSLKKRFKFFMALNYLILQRLGGGSSSEKADDKNVPEPTPQEQASDCDNTGEQNAVLESDNINMPVRIGPRFAMNFESTYYEKETTSYSASGTINTNDGKEVGFNVELKMERELKEKIEMSIMMDPLIINFNGTHAELVNEYFDFDLNADGKTESIPGLSAGSGMLVYDKDKSGIIEDGSEVIGGKSGKGFAELRSYDDDKNGWIDENDEIYNKLSIWQKNEGGKDVLLSLKEADLGAINLADVETEFSLIEDKERLGVIKSTSFALTDSYQAITIQQLDIATKQTE